MLSKALNIEIDLVGMNPNGQIKSATLCVEGSLVTLDVRTAIASSEFFLCECLFLFNGVSHIDGDLNALEFREVDEPFNNLHS
jgi:hypothetical protein